MRTRWATEQSPHLGVRRCWGQTVRAHTREAVGSARVTRAGGRRTSRWCSACRRFSDRSGCAPPSSRAPRRTRATSRTGRGTLRAASDRAAARAARRRDACRAPPAAALLPRRARPVAPGRQARVRRRRAGHRRRPAPANPSRAQPLRRSHHRRVPRARPPPPAGEARCPSRRTRAINGAFTHHVPSRHVGAGLEEQLDAPCGTRVCRCMQRRVTSLKIAAWVGGCSMGEQILECLGLVAVRREPHSGPTPGATLIDLPPVLQLLLELQYGLRDSTAGRGKPFLAAQGRQRRCLLYQMQRGLNDARGGVRLCRGRCRSGRGGAQTARASAISFATRCAGDQTQCNPARLT